MSVSESANLGLANARGAVQAYGIKEGIASSEAATRILWGASDWNLADCWTKASEECRRSIRQWLKTCSWRIKYDPQFLAAKKATPALRQLAEEEPAIGAVRSATREDGVSGDLL